MKLNPSLWNSPHLDHLSFFRIQYEDFEFKPHFHDHYVIQLVRSGVNLGERERKTYAVSPGELLVINPGETHTGGVKGNEKLDYMGLYPENEFFEDFLADCPVLQGKTVFRQEVISDQELANSLQKLIYISSTSHDALEVQSLVLDFFALLGERYVYHRPKGTRWGNERSGIRKAVEFIGENYRRNFSLHELSDYVALSPWHFSRVFRRDTGLTPFEYLRNIRVEKARKLLLDNHSLMDALHLTGFYDQSHFIRHFKAITGFTPGRFIRQ